MLYHFQLELSDIDRNVYESLDFRVIQHPSESVAYLLTRTLAYAHCYQENLEFSPKGLGDPETPAMQVAGGAMGGIELWVEIGNPSARKLHKASKATKRLLVYTYKNPEILTKEITDNKVHRADEIEIYAFKMNFIEQLEARLKKNNQWTLIIQQGRLSVEIGDESISCEIQKIKWN